MSDWRNLLFVELAEAYSLRKPEPGQYNTLLNIDATEMKT